MYSCSTARRRYQDYKCIPIQEALHERPKEENLSMALAGSPLSKPEGGVLDCGVATADGGGSLSFLHKGIGPFPWLMSVQRRASL